MQIPADKIGMVIGAGGRTLRSIEEESGTSIDIDGRSGTVQLKGPSDDSLAKAKEMIAAVACDPEPGSKLCAFQLAMRMIIIVIIEI
jgi:polyribonucleotide nucleotidyltransferase